MKEKEEVSNSQNNLTSINSNSPKGEKSNQNDLDIISELSETSGQTEINSTIQYGSTIGIDSTIENYQKSRFVTFRLCQKNFIQKLSSNKRKNSFNELKYPLENMLDNINNDYCVTVNFEKDNSFSSDF